MRQPVRVTYYRETRVRVFFLKKIRRLMRSILFPSAFLPSTFTMYTTMIAFYYALRPVSMTSGRRISKTIFWVGLGSLIAWPFSAAIGIPAALEELTLRTNAIRRRFERVQRILLGLITSLCYILVCSTICPSPFINRELLMKLCVFSRYLSSWRTIISTNNSMLYR